MGAVISLRLAVENKAVEFSERISRVSARISKKVGTSRESRRSRMSEGSNAWSEASETAAGPSAGTGADGAGTSGADGSSSVVGVESRSVDVEIARPGSKRASRDPDLRPMRQAYHGTVRQVLTSKFVLMQCLFNMLSSVACSVALFYLLFVVAVVPPGDPLLTYKWHDPNLIGVVVGSSLFVSPTLVMVLAPAGLPEAVEKKWFYVLRPADVPRPLRLLLPYLGTHKCWRIGCARYLCLGIVQSIIFIPLPILIAYYAVADKQGNMSTWTLIWFDLIYETILTIPCTLGGLLGWSMQHNYDRVVATMSTHPKPLPRLGYRIINCFKLLF